MTKNPPSSTTNNSKTPQKNQISSLSSQSFLIQTKIIDFAPSDISALVDCGASSNFIDSALANARPDLLVPLSEPIPLELFDGRPSEDRLTHSVSTAVTFPDGTVQIIQFLVTKVHPLTPIVLGLAWL
jgi:hypothetical protein